MPSFIHTARQAGKSWVGRLLSLAREHLLPPKDILEMPAEKALPNATKAAEEVPEQEPQGPRFVRPNRAVRRAIKLNRESRLPQEWRQFLLVQPKAREYIRSL